MSIQIVADRIFINPQWLVMFLAIEFTAITLGVVCLYVLAWMYKHWQPR